MRRAFLGLLLGGTAGAFGMSRPLLARGKLTKQEADYRDTPMGIQMCATCSLFEPPASCKIVEGAVGPNGWCKDYVIVD